MATLLDEGLVAAYEGALWLRNVGEKCDSMQVG